MKVTSCLVLLLLAAGSAAQAQLLVTEAEAAAARAAAEALTPKAAAVPDAPRIDLLAPDIGQPVPSPTRIWIRFEPVAPALIRPESFRVRYGALRLDITGRITAVSKVAPDGIDVAAAELPKGAHKLYLEIQDTLGRNGERLLQFVVR